MLMQKQFTQCKVMDDEDATVSIYLNEIPVFVEEELQRLYGSIHSSLPYFRIFKGTDQVSTYIAQKNKIATAVLLFRVHKSSVEVLNERFQISDDELRRFVEHMFKRLPSVAVIRFNSTHAKMDDFPYPFQKNHGSDAQEIAVLDLPDSVEDYLSRLSSKLRQSIRASHNKFKRDHPGFSIKSYEREEIDEALVHKLIALKKAAFSSKEVAFSIDEMQERKIVDLARSAGIITVICIDDRIVAGSINYRVGLGVSAGIIAHDHQYNAYSPGTLAVYLSICESIKRGIKRYDMGAGKNEYKYRFLAVVNDMHEVEIYRSVGHMILHGWQVMRTWTRARMFSMTMQMHKHRSTPLGSSFFNTYALVRRIGGKDSLK